MGGNNRLKAWVSVVPAALVVALTVPVGAASADEPGTPSTMESDIRLVAGGPGNQTDPHLSGELLVFTESDSAGSRIRYVDLATGTEGDVPTLGHRDSLADVAGDLIVFRRVFTDGSSSERPILVFDVDAPQLGTREVAPLEGARRSRASIGGTTVAFMQQSGTTSSQQEICVADVSDPAAAATCVTSDGLLNQDPAVSPDGSAVAFTKCLNTGLDCDVHVATRTAGGSWGVPVLLTGAGDDIFPGIGEDLVTYASDAAGDFDIWWEHPDGTAEERLVLTDAPGSVESNPSISGGMITFERELPGESTADLWLYRPATDDLFRLTDTPDDETLNDVSVSQSGDLVVSFARADGTVLGSNDIHVLRAPLPAADDEAPALTLPGDLTVDATGPAGTAVTFEAVATDGGPVPVTCTPSSGSTFAIGTTTVTCSALDEVGNSAGGSFSVTVRGARAQLVDFLVAVTQVDPSGRLASIIRTAVHRLPERALPALCRPIGLIAARLADESGRSFPAETAVVLIADANRIRAVLACS